MICIHVLASITVISEWFWIWLKLPDNDAELFSAGIKALPVSDC